MRAFLISDSRRAGRTFVSVFQSGSSGFDGGTLWVARAKFCFSTEEVDVGFHASAATSRKFFNDWSVGVFDEALRDLLDLLDEIQLEFGEADY